MPVNSAVSFNINKCFLPILLYASSCLPPLLYPLLPLNFRFPVPDIAVLQVLDDTGQIWDKVI